MIFSNLIFADPKMELGLDLYNDKAQCGACQTLQAPGLKEQIGLNLEQLRSSIPQVIAVANGISVKSPFEGTLSSEKVEAAAYFVSARAGH